MVTRKTAKCKGSQFEYDCQYSLSKIYPDIYRTAERGFQKQYDLITDKYVEVFECKRLKGISWNKLVKIYNKLSKKAPSHYEVNILFKSNRQPCLVFNLCSEGFRIMNFEDFFRTPFEKHPSTRSKNE